MHLSEADSRSRASAATQVAPFQRDDVRRRHSPRQESNDLPRRAAPSPGRGQLFERGDGLLGLELLVEADGRIEETMARIAMQSSASPRGRR